MGSAERPAISPRGKWLTIDEALAMIEAMKADAEVQEMREESPEEIARWDGWWGALDTLRQHIQTGVKASCFPIGTCSCHPVNIPGRER